MLTDPELQKEMKFDEFKFDFNAYLENKKK